MKYFQFDEEVIAVRSVIIEAETEEMAKELFNVTNENHFRYKRLESVKMIISEHLFKPY
jgi:hypothetical protein